MDWLLLMTCTNYASGGGGRSLHTFFDNTGGGGGGGGGYDFKDLQVTPGESIAYTVGCRGHQRHQKRCH